MGSTRTGLVILGLGLVAALAGLPTPALADARVAVRLTDHEGRPVDGSVTLTAGGLTRSCRTTASRCTITAPAGTYTVTMRPNRGSAPPSRTFRVPASGTVSLALTAAAPQAQVAATAASTTSTATRVAPSSGTGTTTAVAPGGSTPVTSRTVRATRATRATRAGRVTRPRTSGTRAAPTFRFRPGVTVSPTAGGDDSTSPSGADSPTTTATPTVTTAAATQAVQTRREDTGRDLTTGTRLVAQGRVLDGAGRPTDATLTVRRSGELVGTAETTAGSFSLYDLATGTYDVALRSSRGTTSTSRITVGTTTARLTLRVP